MAHTGKCRVRLWAIIGESNVGKSPTIRALVSQPGNGRTSRVSQVLLRGGGYLDVHCKVMALQEAGWTPEMTAKHVDDWIAVQSAIRPRISPAFINVLFALRFDGFYYDGKEGEHEVPPAEDYLSHFVGAGWDIQRLVLMSPGDSRDHLSRFGVPTLWVENSAEANQANGAVRNHFEWA